MSQAFASFVCPRHVAALFSGSFTMLLRSFFAIVPKNRGTQETGNFGILELGSVYLGLGILGIWGCLVWPGYVGIPLGPGLPWDNLGLIHDLEYDGLIS